MKLFFSKMHGVGNDFVVINNLDNHLTINSDWVKHIANRRTGVGFDQLLVLESPKNIAAQFACRIFNADGSEAGQCGNGARCMARYVHENGLTNDKSFSLQVASRVMHVNIENYDQISVDMGEPILVPMEIPFNETKQAKQYVLQCYEKEFRIMAVSMGNPHAVIKVDEVAQAPVQKFGSMIEKHRDFPEGVNVGFMQIVDKNTIRLRVFERGVGETLGCGSGACAAVVGGVLNDYLNDKVDVCLPGGTLKIEWQGEGQTVKMSGPAVKVYEGYLDV
ncbi:MAG: diaminopimelate epimerase [Gammaproteobacteria bacterium]